MTTAITLIILITLIIPLLAQPALAALNFDASGRRVNHGSAASIDNMTAGGTLTMWCWVNPTTATAANQFIISKTGAAGTEGFYLQADSSDFGFVVRRVGDTFYFSSGDQLSSGVDYFLAATYDDSLSPEGDLYIGTLTSAVAEVSSYDAASADGSGDEDDDSGNDLWIGNLEFDTTARFQGIVSRCGIIQARLTLAELRRIQFTTVGQANVANTKLLVDYYGTGTQADYSGNNNAGTVTSATAADHAPLRAPFGTDDGNAYYAVRDEEPPLKRFALYMKKFYLAHIKPILGFL